MADLNPEEKKRLEADTVINILYRRQNEINDLKKQLDSYYSPIRKNVNESEKDFKERIKTSNDVKNIENEIKSKEEEIIKESNKAKLTDNKYLKEKYNQEIKQNAPFVTTIQKSKKKPMAKQNNEAVNINSLYKDSKNRILNEKEIKFLERQKSLSNENSRDHKLSNTLINKNRIKQSFENYKKVQNRLDELKEADIYNMSDDEFNKFKAEKNNLEAYRGRVEGVLQNFIKDVKNPKQEMGGLPNLTTTAKKIYNYLLNLDEQISDQYNPENAFYKIPEKQTEFDINLDKISENLPQSLNVERYDGSVEESLDETSLTDPNATTATPPATTTATTTATTATGTEKINDLAPSDEKIKVDDLPRTNEEILIQKQKELEAYQNTESFVPEEYDDTYLPDQQTDSNVLETALDVGRGIVGAIGASKELPEYAMSPEQRLAIDEATARRNMGLSPDELGVIERGQEEAYGYDIKNIEKASGGSAGVFLGNIGRAQSQLYGQKARTAALDQQLRRQNLANFQNMAGKAENINRQIFLDDLRQAERTKMSGAQTLADSISNIKEREQFEKAYGKGSQFYALQKAMTQNIEQQKVDSRNAARLNLFNQEQEIEKEKNRLTQEIQELQKKTGKGLGNNNNTFLGNNNNTFRPQTGETAIKKVIDDDVQNKKTPDTKTLFSQKIDAEIKDLYDKMNDPNASVKDSFKYDKKINLLKKQRREGTKSLFANK